MLYALGFAKFAHASRSPKVNRGRALAAREESTVEDSRSDLTVGSETSVASQTMLAILQMTETAVDDVSETLPTAARFATTADEDQIWWINHPLMQQNYDLHDNIDDCYAAMKRIVESNADRISEPGDFENLKTAIEDHTIKFPVTNGSQQIFNIIEIFFVQQTPLQA